MKDGRVQRNFYDAEGLRHVGSHKELYYRYVNSYLQNGLKNIANSGRKATKADVVVLLNDIRQGLLNGTVKLN